MGIFFDTSGSNIYLPCFTLIDAPRVVPLPGVSYMISFDRDSIIHVLTEFKQNESFRKHHLLNDVDISLAQNEIIVDASVAKSCVDFHKKYASGGDEIKNDIPIYLVLLPFEATNHSIGAACRVTEVVFLEKTVMITFKSICRVDIKQTLLNMKQRLWKSNVTPIDDFSVLKKWDQNTIDQSIASFVNNFNQTDKVITDFKGKYNIASKRSSNLEDHIFLLSPLANTLFFQLSKSQFMRAWKLLKVYLEELKVHERNRETCFELASMMDLVISILPTTLNQRLEFLCAKNLNSRGSLYIDFIKEFHAVFTKLYESSEYVNTHFKDAPSFEKSKLIANQLKGLRFYIDDVKRNNTSAAFISNSKNDISGISSKSVKYLKSKQSDVDLESDSNEEVETIKKFIDSLGEKNLNPDGIKLLNKDFRRFAKMTAQNADYQVLRNYFDIIMDVPFGKTINFTSIDLNKSRKKLNDDHYGLQSVKKRLMEYLSVLKLSEITSLDSTSSIDAEKNEHKSKGKSPILLLVGPPGVGKTSIAKSVAEVLGRKFQRISLGGIHNEAEIRGHRRTYVGSMCGLVINALRKSGSMNPLILLDEIDKVLNAGAGGFGTRVNGDPGAALLEVLDPEQNSTFTDHYVGFPVDLSQVLFFCTANDLEGISEPLLNRMELIEIPGYSPEEKINIGSKFLLPKQIRSNGLSSLKGLPRIQLTDEAWDCIVMEYTREPGVRSLERRLATIVRGKVVEYVESKTIDGEVTKEALYKYLGLAQHPISNELIQPTRHSERFGVVNGLSYNSDGTGSVLVFEMIKVHSEESANGPFIKTTGNLGNILEESIKIATSYIKHLLLRSLIPDVDEKTIAAFLSSEYHLHVPMGAVSKDGPSAGAAISLAILSSALKKPVSNKLCMTGEITLRGKILPIGGVKEKILGAQLFQMDHLLLPAANRRDVIQTVSSDQQEQYKLWSDLTYPEIERFQHKTNLKLTYCSDFFDVLKATWPDMFNSTLLQPRPCL